LPTGTRSIQSQIHADAGVVAIDGDTSYVGDLHLLDVSTVASSSPEVKPTLRLCPGTTPTRMFFLYFINIHASA